MHWSAEWSRTILAGLLVALAAPVLAAPPTTLVPGKLSVCLSAIPPFAAKSEAGQWDGWDVDYMKGFASRIGLAFAPVEVTEDKGSWTRPGADACDVAASGIADLGDRRHEVGEAGRWSTPYYFDRRAFAVRNADADHLKGIRDLEARTVLVIAGSPADVDARSRVAAANVADVTIIGTWDDVDNARKVRDVVDGEPFAFGSGVATVQYLADRMGLVPVWPHCLMLPDGQLRDEPLSFVVRTKSEGLLEALNAFIAATPYPGGRGTDECPSRRR